MTALNRYCHNCEKNCHNYEKFCLNCEKYCHNFEKDYKTGNHNKEKGIVRRRLSFVGGSPSDYK